MSIATCHTTAGVFATRAAADRAVAELKRAGYRDDQIGVVAKDEGGKTVKRDGSGSEETHAGEGAAIGAAAGAGVLALGSLAVSFAVIPVIGPVLAMGPLAAALVSAGAGAAAGGVAGALIGWGIPEEDARYYEGQVNAGRYLVTVECGQGDDARDLLARHGGYDRVSAPKM
ncbi:MAG TPA: general stress protein [Urbifossiella sp.]|nr:general stress protein [Urbifossiella sp.]